MSSGASSAHRATFFPQDSRRFLRILQDFVGHRSVILGSNDHPRAKVIFPRPVAWSFESASAGQRLAGPYSGTWADAKHSPVPLVRTRGASIGGGSTAPQRSAM